ncbi:Uncharacterized protein DAT39_009128, partial [Clarias magur]
CSTSKAFFSYSMSGQKAEPRIECKGHHRDLPGARANAVGGPQGHGADPGAPEARGLGSNPTHQIPEGISER